MSIDSSLKHVVQLGHRTVSRRCTFSPQNQGFGGGVFQGFPSVPDVFLSPKVAASCTWQQAEVADNLSDQVRMHRLLEFQVVIKLLPEKMPRIHITLTYPPIF